METFPIIDEKKGNRSFAFEIENAYIAPRTAARVIRAVAGASDVRLHGLFGWPREVHVEFTFCGRKYVMSEPFGDNSRYWIGPEDPERDGDDVSALEEAFRAYRPPLLRQILGDLVSLRVPRLFRGRRGPA